MQQILVIEDESDNRRLIVDILKSQDYRVISAEDGTSGIQLALEHLPDLIVSDVNMPDMDGFAVLTALRENPITESIPFIFLTALGEMKNVRWGMGLGADDYLIKPFYINDLISAVHIRLEKQARVARGAEEKLNELRRNITHALPHEFRTPLGIVIGMSSLLADDIDPERGEMIQTILSSANRLNQMTEKFWVYVETEIIAASPVSSEALKNNRVESACAIINAVAFEIAQHFNRERDVVLSMSDASLQISDQHLSRIIDEIVHNAFKFSPPGTLVEISAWADENDYHIRVTNEGRGMTPDQIARIGAYMQFEREQYEQKGVGLGLTISRRLAELYGGTLDIESVPNQQLIVDVTLLQAGRAA